MAQLCAPPAATCCTPKASDCAAPAAAIALSTSASSDGVFPYYFGCYACTPAPIRLEAFHGRGLVDVTAQHPDFVEANARRLWRSVAAGENGGDGYYSMFGTLAAWTAEECTIGRGASAWSRVRGLQRRGVLSDQHYYRGTFMTKGSFVPTLKSFLFKNGYCLNQIP